ncbi:hypothetical protein EYF80_048701 [Liparis tanakae]|uniref:Uncharacterized protein n=1 Tax=Liparis tanakae TaxID=230148 RepID=A0A4Z2FK04_9TELE|nr:hypothetical protein EYF80_048701 [Liparis tanakae]
MYTFITSCPSSSFSTSWSSTAPSTVTSVPSSDTIFPASSTREGEHTSHDIEDVHPVFGDVAHSDPFLVPVESHHAGFADVVVVVVFAVHVLGNHVLDGVLDD